MGSTISWDHEFNRRFNDNQGRNIYTVPERLYDGDMNGQLISDLFQVADEVGTDIRFEDYLGDTDEEEDR